MRQLLHVMTMTALICGAWNSRAAEGYTDTPIIPGQKWRVHDAERPRPPVIQPGTASTQNQPGQPPSDAIVLFDGKDLSQWRNQNWAIQDGAMIASKGNNETTNQFGTCQLHIEWAAPAEVKGRSQGRGNSGIFLMGRYEIQVLDCYENETYADGQTAAIYGVHPPLVNACRKPGEWQTYDIIFEAPEFNEEKKMIRPATVTVFHNGVLVHYKREFLGPSGHRNVPPYVAHPPTGPLVLQDHGNPVRFRNIWVRPIDFSKAP